MSSVLQRAVTFQRRIGRWRHLSRVAIVVVAQSTVASIFCSARVDAAVISYDLAADWSDISNPNGVWSYGTQTSPATFNPFPVHVPDYINFGGAAFSGNQPAWTNQAITGNNGSPEGLAKSLGIAIGMDFPTGRVGGHTPQSDANYLAIRWIAPQAGTIDLTGGVWMWRDINRVNQLSLYVNGTALFDDVLIPERSAGTTSANPFLLSSAIVADGGAAANLLGISVSSGDSVILATRRISTAVNEDFVGFDFSIALTTAVPEPSSVVMLGIGLLGFVANGWRLRGKRRLRAETSNSRIA